eukprot:403361458
MLVENSYQEISQQTNIQERNEQQLLYPITSQQDLLETQLNIKDSQEPPTLKIVYYETLKYLTATLTPTLTQFFEKVDKLMGIQNSQSETIAYFIDPQLDFIEIQSDKEWQFIITDAARILGMKYLVITVIKISDLICFQNHQFMQLFVRNLIDTQHKCQQESEQQQRRNLKRKRVSSTNEYQVSLYTQQKEYDEILNLDFDRKEELQSMIQLVVDISLYNQSYHTSSTDVSLLPSKKPQINEETLFLINLIKDAFRKFQLQAAFVDVSHIKTLKHLQFGREVSEVLIFGQSKFLTFYASEWQINMLKTRIDPNIPQIILIDTFCKLKSCAFNPKQLDWECVINLQFLDYTNYKFYTLLHCISQSEKSESVPHVLDWCKKEFGDHVFKPTLLIIDGELNTFDSIHAQYSKHVSIYVPFFGYAYQVLREFRIRSIPIKTPIIRVLMFYFKLLAFVDQQTIKNRYADVKRIFQTDIISDLWMDIERNFLKDEFHMSKWANSKCEDSKLLIAINKQQEKSLMLVDEQIQPSQNNQDNLGQLIEGIQRLEQLQREEFENGEEKTLRWYPQLSFLMRIRENPNIIKRAFDILISQTNKLKYGCDSADGSFVCPESFVEYFFNNFDMEYLDLVDTDDMIERLGFEYHDIKNK